MCVFVCVCLCVCVCVCVCGERESVCVDRDEQKKGHESGIQNRVYACFTVMLAPSAWTDWRPW